METSCWNRSHYFLLIYDAKSSKHASVTITIVLFRGSFKIRPHSATRENHSDRPGVTPVRPTNNAVHHHHHRRAARFNATGSRRGVVARVRKLRNGSEARTRDPAFRKSVASHPASECRFVGRAPRQDAGRIKEHGGFLRTSCRSFYKYDIMLLYGSLCSNTRMR